MKTLGRKHFKGAARFARCYFRLLWNWRKYDSKPHVGVVAGV